MPEWSGYYFDAIGDPCAGDTVAFAVLHSDGSLPGTENIRWFKDDQLIPAMNNEDTLLIYGSGKYVCKIINQGSTCPFDTTTYAIEYDCGDAVGLVETDRKLSWTVFPNPASETITIKNMRAGEKEKIEIYSGTGSLIRSAEASGEITVEIADLCPGLYFVLLKNQGRAIKFIKI
jgi:Secretion system C-terminal sorting domain